MKLQTQQIKEFQRKSSAIKTGSIIPSLSYIMLQVENGICSLIKTNLSIYCKYSFQLDEQDTVIMIEEQSLSTFASATKAMEFDIMVSGKTITLTDGKLTIPFTTIPHEDFPKFPGSVVKDPYTLTEDVISAMASAANFLSGNQDNYNYVHTAYNNVFGGHQFAIFLKKFTDLPIISLPADACSILNQYSELTHYTSGNVDFFNSGSTIYGFTKTEHKCPDYVRIMEKANTDGGFIINKSDIVSFCQTAMSLSDEKAPVCSLFMDGMNAKAVYNNKGKGKGNELVIDIDGSILNEINFSPDVFIKMKHLPYTKLNISVNGFMCFVTTEEDPNYMGVFSQAVKN